MEPDELGDAGDVLSLLERPAWHTLAACRARPDVNFFPAKGEPAEGARAVCAGCPVTEDCLADAIQHGDTAGFWGGLSPKERRDLARAQRAA